MRTESFQTMFARFGSFIGGLICLAFAVYCVRKQSVWWRFPFYSHIRRQEQPVLYWFAVSMLFVVGIAGLLSAVFNVKTLSSQNDA